MWDYSAGLCLGNGQETRVSGIKQGTDTHVDVIEAPSEGSRGRDCSSGWAWAEAEGQQDAQKLTVNEEVVRIQASGSLTLPKSLSHPLATSSLWLSGKTGQ